MSTIFAVGIAAIALLTLLAVTPTLTGMAYQPYFLSEGVTCLFSGSTSMQWCTSPLGKCTGRTSCTVLVSGRRGQRINWQSSCGTATTTIDGISENAVLRCGEPVSARCPEGQYRLFQHGGEYRTLRCTNGRWNAMAVLSPMLVGQP